MKPNNSPPGWICPSHPTIRWDAAGRCPICRQNLVEGSVSVAAARQFRAVDRRRFLKRTVALISGLLVWSCGANRILPLADAACCGQGRGMGSGCMMGGHGSVTIPQTLPTPKSSTWLHNLREVLSLERLSLVQYQTDEDKFQVFRPYRMIIPQEDDHIAWIGQLFSAYGLSAAEPTLSIKRSGSITQAYEIALQLENKLRPRYQWLIARAEDNDTRQVLNLIDAQTRHHAMMFSHALNMGGMSGGMMGCGGRM
jgi:hypothetical protein